MASSITAGPRAVVSGSGSGMPGIEVRAEHNDFVGFGFVCAGDFADDIEGIQIVIVEPVLDIELKSDGDFFLEHADDAAVVFAGDGDARKSWRILFFVTATPPHHENLAVIAAGRLNPGGAFFKQKLLYLKI